MPLDNEKDLIIHNSNHKLNKSISSSRNKDNISTQNKSIDKLNLPSLPSNYVVQAKKGMRQIKTINLNISTPEPESI